MAPTIWEPSNVYASAKLGEDVSVGKFTEIGPEVSIGNDCFIGPMVYMTNDRFPPSEKSKWKKTIIEDEAAIGAGVTILCGVTIGRKSMIGCGSVVVQSVPPNEIWVGVPAKKLRDRPA